MNFTAQFAWVCDIYTAKLVKRLGIGVSIDSGNKLTKGKHEDLRFITEKNLSFRLGLDKFARESKTTTELKIVNLIPKLQLSSSFEIIYKKFALTTGSYVY